MADTIKLWWAWRSKARNPLLRSIILLLTAVLFAAATGEASVFSSLVVDTTNLHILVKNQGCGWVNGFRAYQGGYLHPVKAASVPYAKQCYYNEGILLWSILDVMFKLHLCSCRSCAASR
jgi:hypothetical protein